MNARPTRRQQRKDRRAARHNAAAQILPPEGVPLTLPVASIGVRMGAQITDILITGAFAVSILIFLGLTGIARGSSVMGIGALLFFAIRIPYYVLSELAWNGQTIGKRMMKIKVVAHDGGPLTTHALVLRNMMKEAEIFLPGTLLLTLDQGNTIDAWLAFFWVILALTIPMTNPHRMRLGDMLAGTHVIHLPHPILLSDLAQETEGRTKKSGTKFLFLAHQLDHYGRFELQKLESFLRAQEKDTGKPMSNHTVETLNAIVENVRKKIGYADAVPAPSQLEFLRVFYNAQRAHLEQRQLFGDRRQDKFHGSSTEKDVD